MPRFNPATPIGLAARHALLLTAVVLLTACDNDDDGEEATTTSYLQVSNAIPESPDLRISLEPEEEDDATDLTDLLAFQSWRDTLFTSREAADYILSIEETDPDTGDLSAFISNTTLTLDTDITTTVLIAGQYDSPQLVLFTRDYHEFDEDTEDDLSEMQVINVSTEDWVEVQLVNEAGNTVLTESLSPMTASTPTLLETEEDITVTTFTVDGNQEAPYFEGEPVPLVANRRYTLVLGDAFREEGPEPYLIDSLGLTDSLVNNLEPSRLRYANATGETSPLSIRLEDALEGTLIDIAQLGPGASSDYLDLDPTVVFFSVEVRNEAGDLVYETVLSLDGDTEYTLGFAGRVADNTLSSQLAETQSQPVATQARLTIVNGSIRNELDEDGELEEIPTDLYVLAQAESIDDTTPSARNLEFLDVATALVPATASLLVLVEAGTTDILAGPEPIIFESGGRYDILLTGEDAIEITVLDVDE